MDLVVAVEARHRAMARFLFVPIPVGLNELFPDRPHKPGLKQGLWDMKKFVVGAAEAQVVDLKPIADHLLPHARGHNVH